MKNLILLNRSGMSPDVMSRKGRYSLDPILSRLCLASLICLCMLTIGSGNVWGAATLTGNVVYSCSPTSIANTTTHQYWGSKSVAKGNSSDLTASAYWEMNIGSNAGLGSNNNQKAKMILSNGSMTGGSAIASAIGKTTSATYVAAFVCNTALANVGKFAFSHDGYNNNAPANMWLCYSTDDWTTATAIALTVGTSGNVTFDATIPSAKYAFVIYKSSYTRVNNPTFTFYEGTTGGGCSDPATALSVSAASTTIYAGVKSQLSTSGGNGNTVTYTVTSANSAYATIDGDKKFSASRPGTYTVQASQDASGGTCGGTSTVDITVRYQIKWSVNGDDTYDTGSPTTYIEEHNGKIATFPTSPASAACDGSKEFVGWTAAPIVGTTNTKPTFVTPQTQITDNTTLYAVFATRTANSYSPGDINDLINGKNVIIYNANQSKAMASSIQATGKLNGLAVTFSSTNISSPDAALIWTVYNSGTKYIFKSGNNYLRVTSNSANTKLTCDGTSDTWTITEASTGVYTLYSTAGSSTYPLEAYFSSPNYFFTSYKGSGANYNMTFYVPTYTAYVTTCCTPLGTINGSISVNNPTSVTLTWSAVTGAEKYQVKVPGSSSHDTWTDVNSTSVTVTKSCGTAYTAYFRAIDTNSSHCSTGPESTLAIPAVSYTVTSTGVTNVTPATAFPSTTCTGFSIASMTPADGYTLPSTITVVNADHIWNSSTGALTISNVTGNVTITITGQVAANFTNGETVFIQADSKDYSAWKDDACVKAYFNTSGSGGSAVTTYWLFDATDDDAGKKLFAAVVPSAGLNQVQLQRFASNCSDWWNANGTVTKASSSGVNTFRSYGSADNNVAWNGSSTTLSLYGSQNSWASSLATFADQGSGVWTATISNYAPDATSKDYKIKTSYNNGWIGNTGSNDNATLSDMKVGSTYNVTATLNVTTHALTMSKTFVKGTVHFDMQGHGSAISDLTNVTAGSKISAPSAPSATGYDFGGWYKEAGCSNAWDFANDVVNETMTLYAKWTKHNYTISSTLNHCSSSPAIPSSYEYTGSAAGLSFTISANDGYRLPTSITVSGTTYTWNSATGALTLTGTITSNVSITITAVQTHTVTWLSNGSNYVSPVTYDHGATLAFPAGTPEAPISCSGKVFVGWTSDSEITTETSTEPTLITAGGAVNTDATYRAVFADEEGGGTTTILNEPFTGFSSNATPTSPGSSATTLDGSSITYTCTAGGSGAGNTNIQTSGGPDGDGNNLLIRKKNGAFTINSIPSNSQTSATLTYKWRGTGTIVLSGSSNISLGSISTETDGSSNNTCTVTITINSGTTYSLTWTNTHTDNNLRFDSPTITCSGVSYDNYITQCCALKPVTNLAVSSSTANSVTLTWTAPSSTTGIDHLELRNASTDAKIGSNIAVGTTSTSVSGLVECNTYSYKIVSVGASCETSSDAIEAQPYSGAKTVTFNYNGGSGSPASFTTSCAGNTVPLPTPDTRTGYTFLGWWSAQFGGVKQGDAGDIYTVSGTTTLWAHWSETNYTVTMAQDPAAGATLTGGTTTAHYGGTINISTTVPSGYRFTGWTASPSVTFADASATSTSFTMPNSDVTVTAHFVQVHTLIFDVPTGGGSAVTPPATADHGGTVTLPNVTGIAAEYSCETFLGWTTTAPNAEGGTKWSSTPMIKAAGATSDVINSNTTFYAVYSRSGGGASGTVELTCTDVNNWWTVTLNSTKNSYGTVTHHTATDGSTWYTDGQIQGAACVDLKAADNRYIQIPTTPGTISSIEMQVSQSTASNTAACGTGTATAHPIAFRTTASGSNVFTGTSSDHSCTINISSGDYYTGYIVNTDGTTNIHSVTVNYGPAPVISHNVACPDCEISQFTLSYNANTTYFPGSTTTCTGVTDYIWAEHDDIYTICSTEPTLAGYKFTGWATNANGSGTVYTAAQEISCVPETPLTLYAQYERVYTIHFNDQGTLTDRTQASSGAAVTVPAHTTPCVMLGATWEFAGWSKTGGSLNDAASATIDIAANATEYTPLAIDEGLTFYAVYKKTLSGGGAFSVGKSGVYKFYYHSGSSDYWAAGKQNTYGIYSTTTAGDAHSFRFTYYPTGTYAGKYTIQNDAGEYIGYSGSSTPLVYNASAADNHYYWTITASGGGFIVQNVQTATRYLASNGGNFNGKTSSEVLSFVAADVVSYYTIMTCASSFSLTFEDGGGTINWEIGHAEGTYQDVSDGTVFTVFPTATMDGWTFIGWTAGQGYSDMSKYSEGRDATTGSGVIVPEDADLYSTGGNSYTIHSNITMYPVFTRFEDNEPIDLTNGGDYYIYYLAPGSDDGYGAEQRVYAASYESHKRYNSSTLCSAATTFTFTKLENGNWTIYDNTTNMYLYGIEDDDLKQQASATGAEWTLTINGNQFDAFHVGTSYGQLIAQGDGTSATIMNYRRTNVTTNPAMYHRVYLGSCTNRVFSSNPSTTPEVDLKGTAVVTASQNGAVRATNVLTVSGHNLTPSTGVITLNSDNGDIYFSLSTDKNFARAAADQPKSSITVTANGSGIVTPTPIYIHYKPSGNTDTWTSATITASYLGAVSQTATVELRLVKENFVIASKVGGSWYALPANMSAEGVFEPVLIEVDESNKVAYGPSTVAYKMWPVQTVNGGTDEYATNGDKVRFAGNSNAGLWASNSNNYIRDWATITAIGSTAETPAAYEWIIQTEDRNAYTLKSMYSTHYLDLYRPSSGGNAGKLVWASNSTYETNEVHFFPLTERAIISIIPREWKSNGLVFAIDADNNISLTAGHTTAKIGTGDAASATLTRHSTGGYGLYEVALPALASHYGKVLTLKMKIGGVDTYAYTTIPIIVTGTTTTTTAETPFTALDAASKDYDVVILDGAKLTTNATASHASKFQNFYVYSGGTWINDNGSTSFNYLELRGGIKGIGAKDSHVQGVPHVMLNKGVTSTAGASLDMTVYTDHGYALSVPFDVDLSKVNFANSLKPGTGAQVNGTLASQFWIRKYDGEVRANNGQGGWVDLEPEEVDEVMVYPTIHAGEGYTLQGKRPKGQPFAVIRFPFTGVASWANASGEVAKADIPIYAHAGGANTPDNDKGWNLIANPYMATIAYNTEDELSWAASFKVGSLTETEGAQWDGKYQWENADHAYVTIPNDSYTAFPQTRASKATFYPFKNFFIQAASNGVVAFVRADRSEMPRHLMAQEEQITPIYADINLAHGGESAQAGLTIDADATTGYKFGEDYTIFESREALDYLKVYTIADGHYLVGNMLTPEETAELIPLEFYAPSAEGEYVFSLDDGSDIDRLEYVILYDAELGLNTNLLTDDYTVALTETGLVENRFSIGLKIKEKDETATGIDNTGGDGERPLKFIYHEKMYILRNGVIYDATGKRVR